MKFPYQAVTVQGVGAQPQEVVWKPVIRLWAIGPNGTERELFGLLDTGAVDTILPTSLIVPLARIFHPPLDSPLTSGFLPKPDR